MVSRLVRVLRSGDPATRHVVTREEFENYWRVLGWAWGGDVEEQHADTPRQTLRP